MKTRYWLLLLCIGAGFTGRAQKPEQLLNSWSGSSPVEKVYLHFDRENYIAGETAWFKAYTWSDHQPDTISTSLYVELVNENDSLLSRSIVPILLGTANGHIEFPASLATGSYLVRAYTATLLNQDPGFISKRGIFIYGGKKTAIVPAKEPLVRMEFFPEGGNCISDFSNTIAFRATNENGLPVAVSGTVLNDLDEVITRFSSIHDGMGMFELAPVPGRKYYTILAGDAAAKKYPLPEQTVKGIALTIIPHPQGNFFEIKQRKADPAFQVAYMIGQMQHHLVFRQEFPSGKEEIQGVINTQKLNSGILQVTFFNRDDQPLAERLCFVNNKEYILQGQLLADTVNFNERGRNKFSIQLKDTVRGSFSVSITDPDYQLSSLREENIFSTLLLTADLKGYIHQPAYYFSSDADSVKTALDLVMMTNGWRRFRWTELAQKAGKTALYKDAAYITLSGKVTLRDTKKPFAEKPLLLMLITEDSTRSMQLISTDKQGNFRLDSMLFFGRSRLFFSDIRGKKNQYIDVQLAADSLTRLYLLPVLPQPPFAVSNPSVIGHHSKIDQDYDAIKRAKGLMLEGVTVKARKKSPLQVLEEKYTTGMFSGEGNKVIDLVNTDEVITDLNIFDYLRSRVAGITVADPNFMDGARPDMNTTSIDDGTSYKVYYRYSPSASSMGPIPMTLYLNETETSASVIATIPAHQIAMIKLYSSFVGATGNGAGGILAIYTKKDADISTLSSSADMVPYRGYSVVKEFYAPDYAVNQSATAAADDRITLDWRPDILVNNVNPRIPLTFYNNDRSKSFKVVVEGMTTDGKMLLIEQTITRKGF